VAVEKVEGVREATFSYAMGDGYVTYDETATSPEEIIGGLERLTAYTATVREDDAGRGRAEGDNNQP
jgi:copper chaperone CopZ